MIKLAEAVLKLVSEDLSKEEKEALRRMHLGGTDALRGKDYSAHTSTISSLMRKGYFDKRGLTDRGKKAAKEIADQEHERLIK